jgi:hypothetical protein
MAVLVRSDAGEDAELAVGDSDAQKAPPTRSRGTRSVAQFISLIPQVECAGFLAPFLPFLEALHDHEKRWREQDRKARGGDHAAEHGDANRLPGARAGAGREDQRHDAENERKRRHDNGPKPRLRRFDSRVGQRFVVMQTAIPRDIDNKDGILGRERDQENDADLGIEIVVDA